LGEIFCEKKLFLGLCSNMIDFTDLRALKIILGFLGLILLILTALMRNFLYNNYKFIEENIFK
jgi:hypothetical protein